MKDIRTEYRIKMGILGEDGHESILEVRVNPAIITSKTKAQLIAHVTGSLKELAEHFVNRLVRVKEDIEIISVPLRE